MTGKAMNAGRQGMAAARRGLLVLGAGMGLGLVLWGAMRGGGDGDAPAAPSSAVALVNGRPVPRDAYEARLKAAEAGDQVDEADRAPRTALLSAMIDEELLVQRALALDLPLHDDKIRQALIAAVRDMALAAARAAPVTEETLRAYYDAAPDSFRAPDGRLPAFADIRFKVEQAYRGARERAALARYVAGLRDQAEIRLLRPDGAEDGL